MMDDKNHQNEASSPGNRTQTKLDSSYDVLLAWWALNSKGDSIANKVYSIFNYLLINIIEIIVGTYEKLFLRLREVSILKIIQKVLSHPEYTVSNTPLILYQTPFRNAISAYFAIQLGITLVKAVLRYFKNKMFFGLQGNGRLSIAEEYFDEHNQSIDTNLDSSFDNERSRGTVPKTAKYFYGLIQKIAFLPIDLYIFSTMLNPLLCLVVCTSLGMAFLITSKLADPEAIKNSESNVLSNIYDSLKTLSRSLPTDDTTSHIDLVNKWLSEQNTQKMPHPAKSAIEELSSKVKEEGPQGGKNLLPVVLSTAKELQNHRIQTSLHGKMYNVMSDAFNTANETAFRATMLFLCGMLILNGQPLAGGTIADMVWLNAMIKTARDAYKTFNNYVRDVRTVKDLQKTLQRFIGTYPAPVSEDVFRRARDIDAIRYFETPKQKALFLFLLSTITFGALTGSITLSMILHFVVSLSDSNLAIASLILITAYNIVNYRLENRYEELNVKDIDSSYINSLSLMVLAILAGIVLSGIQPSIIIQSSKYYYASFYRFVTLKTGISNFTVISLVFANVITACMYLGYKGLNAVHRLAQAPAFVVDILLIFFSQSFASIFHYICFSPELLAEGAIAIHTRYYAPPSHNLSDILLRTVNYMLIAATCAGIYINPHYLLAINPMKGVLPSCATLLTSIYFYQYSTYSVSLPILLYTTAKYSHILAPYFVASTHNFMLAFAFSTIAIAIDCYLYTPLSQQYHNVCRVINEYCHSAKPSDEIISDYSHLRDTPTPSGRNSTTDLLTFGGLGSIF